MKNIKCLIVGLGNIAVGYDGFIKNKNIFYTHAKSINASKSFTLIGGVDQSKKKRDIFYKLYGKPIFKKINESLSSLKPSLVVLSTPTNTHLHCIKEITKYKCVKFIICEKPLSNNLLEAKKIVNICKEKKIKLFVNYFRISEPSSQKLKKIFLKEKNINGKVYYSRGYFNNCSHFFNLFEYFFGKFKSGSPTSKPKNYKKNDFSLNFNVKFDGAHIDFICKNSRFNQFKFDLNYRNNSIKYRRNGEQIFKINNKTSKVLIKNSMDKYQLNVYNELSKHISKKTYHLCSGTVALKTINNMHKVLYNEKI